MILNDFKKMFKELNKANLELMSKKGHDYAGEDDFLKNFKVVPGVLKLLEVKECKEPWQYALVLIVLKIFRYTNLKNQKVLPMNETLLDTLNDLRNYITLLYALEVEKNEKK